MAFSTFTKRFRDISLAKKLYFVVGIMALLIVVELFTLWFAISTLSSLRAFVGGEGLWSKGQKDAVYSLQKYGQTKNESDFANFREYMKVPLGDHKTRLELLKVNPTWSVARQGFLEGKNHPDDIDGMINLFRRFHSISYIKSAIIIWSSADSIVSEIIPIADSLHHEINSVTPSQQKITELLNQAETISKSLTIQEDKFSFVLGEGSRWLENLILKLLFTVALTVEISGLLLTISVSRRLQKGLHEIINVSKRIGTGDFTAKAKAYSNDEIGILANSFNQMSHELSKTTDALKNYSIKLEQSNAGLKQFAYVASHDLKEPLRKIITFSLRLQEEYKSKIDEKGQVFLSKIESSAYRLQKLIDDILNFSRLNGEYFTFEKTDLNILLNQVLTEMDIAIEKRNAKISVQQFPIIEVSKSQMEQLFQNLISNSLKFMQSGESPRIEISSEEILGNDLQIFNEIKMHYKFSGSSELQWKKEVFCKISLKDNGIGIAPEYRNRIFEVFQRLNTSSEYEGNGIGLAICKKIIETHHGIIYVESKIGVGTTFVIILPVSQKNFASS